ncbi:MAG: type IV pilus secretin PilQ, partial [Nitrospirae bacterium]|nr:type IV pilus secretin PilQ [Nitrospirota bacterium]
LCIMATGLGAVEPRGTTPLYGETTEAPPGPVPQQAMTIESHTLDKPVKDSGAATKPLFSMELRDAEIRDVLRVLGQESRLNVIAGEEVVGKVTLSFQNVTLTEALDAILKSRGYTFIREGNILVVVPVEKEEQYLQTKTFTLNYLDPKEIEKVLKELKSKSGKVIAEPGSNTVIVKDLPQNLAHMEKLVRALDTRTPQVLIEARIVETTRNYVKDLGIQWGGSFNASPFFGNALPYLFPNTLSLSGGPSKAPGTGGTTGTGTTGGTTPLGTGITTIPGLPLTPGKTGAIGTTGTTGAGVSADNYVVNLPTTLPAFGVLGLTLGSITSSVVLNIRLSALEDTGVARILSNPKILTLNNREAKIISGIEIPVQTVQVVGVGAGGAAGAGTTGIERIKAALELTVVPQVTSDKQIMLKINTKKDEPDFSRVVLGIPTIIKKEATTFLMLRDGETVVIGGIITKREETSDKEIPGLGKIPVLGWLFKNERKNLDQTELLIFLTPTIYKGTQ